MLVTSYCCAAWVSSAWCNTCHWSGPGIQNFQEWCNMLHNTWQNPEVLLVWYALSAMIRHMLLANHIWQHKQILTNYCIIAWEWLHMFRKQCNICTFLKVAQGSFCWRNRFARADTSWIASVALPKLKFSKCAFTSTTYAQHTPMSGMQITCNKSLVFDKVKAEQAESWSRLMSRWTSALLFVMFIAQTANAAAESAVSMQAKILHLHFLHMFASDLQSFSPGSLHWQWKLDLRT